MALARMDGIVKTWPRILLRVEGAVIFGATIWAYGKSGASWWLFAAGLLLPDLGMVGYLKDSISGAITYNAVHTEIVPVILLCIGYAQRNTRLVNVALIWLAHINSKFSKAITSRIALELLIVFFTMQWTE